MRRFVFILSLFLVFKLEAQINYLYSDGNSNSYTVKETQIQYEPVSKEESSSGLYHGGEPKIVIISPYELNKIKILFEEAISDTTSQQLKRSLGSGLLIRYNKTTQEKKVILKYGSGHLLKIDIALKELLK